MTEALVRWLALVAIVYAGVPVIARADGPFEGDYRQGATRIEVVVQTWGPDCGPRPQSTTVPARGAVHVTQDGDHLAFGTRRSTRRCWSENPGVRVVSSRVQSGSWQVVCRTPPDDPRRETATTTLRAAADRIELRDETEYDWSLNESRCSARVVSTQTFERVSGTTPPTPPPETPEVPTACSPGAPARLVLRAPTAELEPGGRVCLQARVVDAAGCAVRDATPVFEVASGTGRLSGACLESASEGTVVVVARAAGVEARVSVVFRRSDLSGLIARRGELGDLSFDPATPSGDAGVAVRTTVPRTPWWLLLVAGAAVLGMLGAILGVVQQRRKREEKRRSLRPAASEPSSAEVPGAWICPTCRQGHGAGGACRRDGTPLVRYEDFVRKPVDSPKRICPKCGASYPASTTFCGVDGTPLG